MMQTLAIFYDAYRALNAKKMFWVVMIISLLLVGVFCFISVNERGLKTFFWQWDLETFNSRIMPPERFYTEFVFRQLGINVWLAWIATGLALISTASIFPDLINSGSIGLLISKPLSRLRLFVTQYAAGLLFVTLQVAVFCLACFLLVGFRGGRWEPRLFLAIPIVVCLFSYLFSVSVLLGVLTRSTLVALLLTLLLWVFTFGIWYTENQILTFTAINEANVSMMDLVAEAFADGRTSKDQAQQEESPEEVARGNARRKEAARKLRTAQRVVIAAATPLPKTLETKGLLRRILLDEPKKSGPPPAGLRTAERVGWIVEREYEQRSAWWIVGTSLAFELVMLVGAAVVFCRRDY